MDRSRQSVFWALAAVDAARQSALEEAEGVGGERWPTQSVAEATCGAAVLLAEPVEEGGER